MNIFEAFKEVQDIPASERLLIGVSLNDEIKWSTGRVDDPDIYRCFTDTVTDTVEDFLTGGRRMKVVITPMNHAHIIVAMGPPSPEAIIEALTLGNELVEQALQD